MNCFCGKKNTKENPHTVWARPRVGPRGKFNVVVCDDCSDYRGPINEKKTIDRLLRER